MRPDRRRPHPVTRRRERGFALIAALAVLVILGSISGVMLRLSGVQQAGVSTVILGQRAQWAARSGLEWGVHESARIGGCPAAATTLDLSEGAVSGFTVVVRCAETSHWEGATRFRNVELSSEASFGALGSRDYVFRELVGTIVL